MGLFSEIFKNVRDLDSNTQKFFNDLEKQKTYTCESCGYKNNEYVAWCVKCGYCIQKGFSYDEITQKLVDERTDKNKRWIRDIADSIKNVKVKAPLSELESEFTNIAKIKKILESFQNKYQNDKTKEHIREINDYLNRDNSFQIAFVGTIKAGKSTLVNAMLKNHYASMDLNPETAVLTKFKYGESDNMKISFYSANEWTNIWNNISDATKNEYTKKGADSIKNEYVGKSAINEMLDTKELDKYISSQSPINYFVKEVEITLKDFPYKENIVFVDTPGLSDPIPYRSEVTAHYISNANAVLVCVVTTESMKSDDITTINKVFENLYNEDSTQENKYQQKQNGPEKVFVIGTKYDRLDNPKVDWEKVIKPKWTEYLTLSNQKGVLDSNVAQYKSYTQELAQRNIMCVAARIALSCELYKKGGLAQTPDNKKSDGLDIQTLSKTCSNLFDSKDIESNMKNLLEFSNVDSIFKRIDNDILNNVEQDIIRQAKNRYKQILNNINAFFLENLKVDMQTYIDSKKDVEDVKKSIDERKANINELQKDKQSIESSLDEFEKASHKTLEALSKAIDELIERIAKDEKMV
ncbi:hypothetical protein DCO58_06950 [Helicobacter saguini]|uniref:Dynamin N-terminal domain-containing protein n=1 Tax=Helicobacter saguini TaxID=1548018 RepID=A0A347VN26_9HELI|nr:dynamin family protein [Helicobacter saguini]MWV61929.1 hypothetical protein [Helicobacter saguini]MWV67396.1 hypothetical protein [Helicobacter saguini]MWV69749.1 hypothetical protein [Helicobacter saguini]MWV73034.1 hypothetical protein [Helicobacter saguini]TLD95590.1 hypothetical protein LS64_001675 [Helicobacter saguini]